MDRVYKFKTRRIGGNSGQLFNFLKPETSVKLVNKKKKHGVSVGKKVKKTILPLSKTNIGKKIASKKKNKLKKTAKKQVKKASKKVTKSKLKQANKKSKGRIRRKKSTAFD